MEALFENPIIIMILLGIISTIFNRMKGGEQEEQKKRTPPARPAPRPARTEYRTEQQDAKPQPQPKPDRNRADVKPETEPQQQIQEIYQDKKREAEERIRQLKKQTETLRGSARSIGESAPAAAQKTESEPVLPNKSTLVEGIIWSEILGPPRAKKPRHPMRHR